MSSDERLKLPFSPGVPPPAILTIYSSIRAYVLTQERIINTRNTSKHTLHIPDHLYAHAIPHLSRVQDFFKHVYLDELRHERKRNNLYVPNKTSPPKFVTLIEHTHYSCNGIARPGLKSSYDAVY